MHPSYRDRQRFIFKLPHPDFSVKIDALERVFIVFCLLVFVLKENYTNATEPKCVSGWRGGALKSFISELFA